MLVDLAHRRFYFFFIEIWPQEFYYVAGLLIMAGIGLFLVTSTVGRAWCGYTCPQTVWTDLFLVVERWIEGDRNARIKLDAAPWSAGKLWKRTTKNILWLLIAVATGGAWIFYFADAPQVLARQFILFLRCPAVAYATVALLTATTFVLAGYLREQVCTYMCPWPRIQAAMLDEDSLVVTYNDWRGEPRSRHKKKAQAAGEAVGDCVDCNACVAVCPAGIDIRDGQQLERITCALCIDACDSVMEKAGSPKGLISYSTLKTYDAHKAGGLAVIGWRSFLRPRTFVYTAIWLAVGLAMFFSLMHRERLDVSILNDRNPLYVKLSDGSIRNGFTVKILNMEQRPRSFILSAEGLPGSTMTMTGGNGEPCANSRLMSKPTSFVPLRSILRFLRSCLGVSRPPSNSRLWRRGPSPRLQPEHPRLLPRPAKGDNAMTRTFTGWHMAAITISFLRSSLPSISLGGLCQHELDRACGGQQLCASQSFNRDAEIARSSRRWAGR